MVQGGALRVAQIVQDGARGADGGGAIGQTAAIEREQFEVIAQRAVGVVVGKDPVFEFGAHEARSGAFFAGEQREVRWKEDFARAHVFERAGHFGGRHVGDLEFAGGNVHVRHPGTCSMIADGGEEVVLPRAD